MEAAMHRVIVFMLGAMAAAAAPVSAEELSKSIMRPTPITSGIVAGNLPGGEGSATYYIALDLKQGALLTQLSVAGRPNTGKRLSFDLLNSDARVEAGTYVSADLNAKGELTRSFPIDSAGRYIVRLTTEGKEAGTYCVLIGGTALPGTAAVCPATAAVVPVAPTIAAAAVPVTQAAPPSPPTAPAKVAEVQEPRHNFEVIVAKCEERLRVGSDFLFDFDRADVRSEAGPTLDDIADRLAAARRNIMIEGHTDAKGSDAYNQALSERRAVAVRASLTERGLPLDRLNIRGYGKTHPVARNQYPDGSDDPDGRQKNRRVEVVVNTCG
jgi:outer membrane protein OmpA-like peptidoglycan-associated protein